MHLSPSHRSLKPVLIAAFLTSLSVLTQAQQPLKVDLGGPGRPNTGAAHFYEWPFSPARPATNLGTITITLRNPADGGRIEPALYKAALDFEARLACDGVVSAGAPAGELEMTIAGLTPGPHTLATYHNSLQSPEHPPARFDVLVNGNPVLTNIQPTIRATNDTTLATAFIRFTAQPGRDTVLRFTPAGAGVRSMVLNGFELDTVNPAAKAAEPAPGDGDEHVEARGGSVRLVWRPPAAALSHDVYFGTNENAVASANRRSPCYQGNQKTAAYLATNLVPSRPYFWRIDEIGPGQALTPGEVWSFAVRQLAFPTAEGYGRFARGGRGGRVLEVTNLNDGGPGSLRAAVEADGPRTVVFNVSGLITLESRLGVRNPYLTIAGQTAPGKGICVRKYNFGLGWTHDVIVRHVRVRPGNLSGATLDGMGMAGCDHCIIDHCSISWTLDEAFSSRGAKNITLQRALISEALNEAGHRNYPPGTQHGYAASIGGAIGSFHHNLLAHCAGRNWSLAGGLNQGGRHTGRLDLRNNVVYNWKNRATDGGAAQVQFVNNYYKPGPATTFFYVLYPQREGVPSFGPQDYYITGNILEGRVTAGEKLGGVRPWRSEPFTNFVYETPFFDPHVITHSAAEAFTNVLADVGCNVPTLDEHDRRVLAEVRAGTAAFKGGKTGLPGLPDSQDDVGGWEDYPEVQRPAGWDTDHDGMPDAWEKAHGLDPKNAADGNGDLTGDGYRNLEKYLNSLTGEYSMPR